MHRGTPISEKPATPAHVPTQLGEAIAGEAVFVDRVLSTAEANVFIGRAKGFLEKRRSSGIDSPRYIQRTKGAAVTYRISDLYAWEDERMRTASSDHDDPMRRNS